MDESNAKEDLTECPNCAELIQSKAIICRFCQVGISALHFYPCPYCNEMVRKNAVLCRFCRSSLSGRSTDLKNDPQASLLFGEDDLLDMQSSLFKPLYIFQIIANELGQAIGKAKNCVILQESLLYVCGDSGSARPFSIDHAGKLSANLSEIKSGAKPVSDLKREIKMWMEAYLTRCRQQLGAAKVDKIVVAAVDAENLEIPSTKQQGNSSLVERRTRLRGLAKPLKSTEKQGMGFYASGVRAQVFEVIVRQAMAGAAWREICASPMLVNGITIEEIEQELKERGYPGR